MNKKPLSKKKNIDRPSPGNKFSKFEKSLPTTYASRPAIWSVLVTTILFLVFYALFTPFFQSNDDVAMMLIASGKITTVTPSEYLLFTNVLLGKLLKGLYTWKNEFPWYGWYLVTSLWLAHVAILYALLRKLPTLLALIGFAVFFVIGTTYTLLSMQFTIIAGIVVLGGLALISLPLGDKSHSWKAALLGFSTYFGIGLVLLAFLIREHSAMLIVVLMVPAGLYLLWENRKDKIWLGIKSGALASAVVLCLGAWKINQAAYQDYENYYEFNALKAALFDYRVLEKIRPERKDKILKQAGWSKSDYTMLMQWFFMDTTIYSMEKLRTIVEQASLEQPKTPPDEIVKFLRAIFTSNGFGRMVSLMLVFCLLLLRDWRQWGTVFASWAMLATVLYIIYLIQKEPPLRVYLPGVLAFASIPLLIGGKWQRLQGLVRLMALIGALIWFVVLSVTIKDELSSDSKLAKELQIQFRSTIKSFHPKEDKIFVVWGGALPLHCILPFDDLGALGHFNVFFLASMQRTPDARKMLDKFNITNIYLDLGKKENIYLVCVERNKDDFRRYMSSHYGRDPIYEELVVIQPSIALFKVHFN